MNSRTLGWGGCQNLEDGSMDARASLNLDPVDINWLISMFQHKLLNGDYT